MQWSRLGLDYMTLRSDIVLVFKCWLTRQSSWSLQCSRSTRWRRRPMKESQPIMQTWWWQMIVESTVWTFRGRQVRMVLGMTNPYRTSGIEHALMVPVGLATPFIIGNADMALDLLHSKYNTKCYNKTPEKWFPCSATGVHCVKYYSNSSNIVLFDQFSTHHPQSTFYQ